MSTTVPSSNSRASIHEVSAALRQGNLALAGQLLAQVPRPPTAILAAAESAMAVRRWSDAAWLFDQVPQRDNGTNIKRCLSRNLAALQKHRPAIYQKLISLPRNDNCGIGVSATGHPTIVSRSPEGRNLALSPNNRPLDGLAAALKLLTPVQDAGQPFALCGIGDGYLWHQLAHKPPKLFLDAELPLFLLEPDAHLVLTALMIHDYTGDSGAIEQPRMQWFVGPEWAVELRQALLGDLFLPAPQVNITLGLDASAIQKHLKEIADDLLKLHSRLGQSLQRHYAAVDREALATVFGPNPPRRPRALFLTTRFSTVLQFSTSDAAAGFRQAGWETRIEIEPTRYHRLLSVATRSILDEFKPDIVFQIDHHRYEHPNMFPANLPFICWIQDHMSQLMTTEAGAKMRETDFFLTDSGPLYVRNFGYPQQQMISVSKLTAPPPLLPRPVDRGCDMIFVSNASANGEMLLDKVLNKAKSAGIDPAFASEAVRRMIDLHNTGESLATYRQVRQFLDDMIAEFGMVLTREQFDELAAVATHPVCDALYRQQALRWAIRAAEELGITLGLYGNGWDQHPEFAAWGKGPVAAGPQLHELTRSAAINLQIVPYFCLHQRVLDGICSGAFFLIRGHISDVAPQAMLDLLQTHCGPDVARLDQARACIPPAVRDTFEALLRDCIDCLCSTGEEDPIEIIRVWQEARMLEASAGVLPHREQVTFTDARAFKARVQRYINDADLREQIVADQRQSLLGRLTYPATMRRVSHKIGQLLASRAPIKNLEQAA